jgi:predicted nucleic acid-binding protein
MNHGVVEASVAIKWYLPEIHSEAARRLLKGSWTLLAPDLLFSECGNVLWKKARLGEIDEQEAAIILSALGKQPLRIAPSWPLAHSALEIALQTQRTVYDSLYLALAVREQSVLITADQKLYEAIRSGPMASYLLWVEDVP